MVKSKEEVVALLMALGDSQDKIAAKLTSLGIKGYKQSCQLCPIAKYLKGNDEVIMSVAGQVTGGVLFVSFYKEERDHASYEFDHGSLPNANAVISFIRAIDIGEYPELVY